MGRKAKPIEPPPDRYLSPDGEQALLAAKSFIYELNTFVQSFRSYYLFDSVYVNTQELKTGKLKTYKKTKKCTVIKSYELIAAPKSWLQEKKYSFIT